MILEIAESYEGSKSSTSLTLSNAPQAGEVLLLLWDGAVNGEPSTEDSGWTPVVSVAGGSSANKPHLHALKKVAGSSESTTYTFSRIGTGYIRAALIRISTNNGDIGGYGSGTRADSLTSINLALSDVPMSAGSMAIGYVAFDGDITGISQTNDFNQQSLSVIGDRNLILTKDIGSTGNVNSLVSWTESVRAGAFLIEVTNVGSPTPTLRKGSQFDVETTLAGTVTSATLDGAAITVDSHAGTTVTLTDSDGSITTSGEYDLVLTDDAAATETITVQVNVYGVAPSNNPLQKDGAALASLTAVEVRVSAGATLAGSQLFYSGTATTDASGNLGNIDLSSTAAADADPVLLSIRTAAGDSIIASETVGII